MGVRGCSVGAFEPASSVRAASTPPSVVSTRGSPASTDEGFVGSSRALVQATVATTIRPQNNRRFFRSFSYERHTLAHACSC
jgi:hypothetical protein